MAAQAVNDNRQPPGTLAAPGEWAETQEQLVDVMARLTEGLVGLDMDEFEWRYGMPGWARTYPGGDA